MTAADFLPERRTSTALRSAVQECRSREHARFVADLRALARGIRDREAS